MAEWTEYLTPGNIAALLGVLSFLGLMVQKIFSAAAKITLLVDQVTRLTHETASLDRRIGNVEERISTLWGFLLSRGIAEAVNKGIATMNSPIVVIPQAFEWLGSLREPLLEFYAEEGHALSDAELAFQIEKRFGERILKEVCIPRNLYMGACLVIAMQLCRPDAPKSGSIYPPVRNDRRVEDNGSPTGVERRVP